MKTIMLGVALVIIFSSCTIRSHPMDMTQAVQSARTRADHERLAKHYEDAARQMEAKAAEHEKLRIQYERYRGMYSRDAQNLIDHCQRLLRAYEQAVEENFAMAKSHRLLAAGAN